MSQRAGVLDLKNTRRTSQVLLRSQNGLIRVRGLALKREHGVKAQANWKSRGADPKENGGQ